jgi:hypothetical protein
MLDIGTRIRLAYYRASDGPRLMLFGPLDAKFGQFQGLLRRLASSPGCSVALHAEPFVAAFGGVTVVLISTGGFFEQARCAPAGLTQTGPNETPTFEWRKTAEGWDYLAELMDGLIKAATPGHQYLTSYPAEAAIVVVSKGEYADDVLDK